MSSSVNTCGPDTVHLTFKEGGGRTPVELASLLQEFQLQYDLPTAAAQRDRGVQGFANAAVDQAAGLRLDWTRPNEEGNNAGFFCLQIKGQWFEAADGETASDFLQLMQQYGPYRCTRLDFQQTTKTVKYLTPWWIKKFETGEFRVAGKKHFEPRGLKNADNQYPAGATIYHGSRSSERFARQYDKHLEQGSGLPRRRDEIEVKGETARNLWTALHEELNLSEQLGTQRGATLHSFSKGSIRALLPIRDCSRWLGKELPTKWNQVANEPGSWSSLFDDDPITVKPRESRVTHLLKSYRYAQANFGSAISVMTLRYIQDYIEGGMDPSGAAHDAYAKVIDDFALGANEQRAMDFIGELPPSQRDAVRAAWFELVRNAASNEERERD